MKAIRIFLLVFAVAGVSGCANMNAKEQRMLSGGALGAAGGAALAAMTGGGWVLGGLIGGAAGTAAGALSR